jgi:membrane protein YqaA with SNARE-associated domain
MMRRLYDWMMGLATHTNAPIALFCVAFIESSFFPIPPDVMLVPMVLAQREKAFWFAGIATVGSVIGGAFGYAIGYFLYDYIGQPVLNFYGYAGRFQEFANLFNEWGVWILIIKGMTPIPFKVVTIAAGVAKMDLAAFIGASIIARSMRFYLVAALLYFFGQPIREFIEHRLTLVTTVFVVFLVGGFVAIKFLV